MVGWNTGADAEMIQAAQSAFGPLLSVSIARPFIQAGHCHCNAGARLARDKSVSANPELCQGF
jgi:hypothetical protein